MKKLFTKISLLFAGLMLCGNVWATPTQIEGTELYWEYSEATLTFTGSGAIPDYEEASQPYYSAIMGDQYMAYVQLQIVFPEGLTGIGAHAFDFGAMLYVFTTDISIPANITSIGAYAFNGWSLLSNVTMEHSSMTDYTKTEFEATTFNGCADNLKIIVPDDMTLMMYTMAHPSPYDGYTFEVAGAASTPQVGDEFTVDGIKYQVNMAVMGVYLVTLVEADGYDNSTLILPELLTIPETEYYASISAIGAEVFQGNTSITSITIPTNVQTIGARAFKNCSNLASVTINGSVQISIGEDAFDTNYSGGTTLNVTFTDSNYSYMAERMTIYASQGLVNNVTINRPVQHNGNYNTLCLPFDLTAEQIANSSLAGAEILGFNDVTKNGDELELDFEPVTEITAGVPYFFRYTTAGDNLSSLSFADITYSTADAQSIAYSGVTLYGTLTMEQVSGDDKLYLAANNELHYSSTTKDIYPFRAYFSVAGGANSAPKARIVTRTNTTTGMDNVLNDKVQSAKVLENGHLFILKNGVKYNAQGQVVK